MTRPYEPRVYKTLVKVTPVGNGGFRVSSDPHPIHTAHVRRNGDGSYRVTFPTIVGGRAVTVDSESSALTRAGDLIGRAAGRDLQAFTVSQRYAMGQQRCPYLLSRHSGRVCSERPSLGSVWCEWHPGGTDRADG